MPIHDDQLLRLYAITMPPGFYHRRDEEPGALFRDGVKVFEITPYTNQSALLISALVPLLNTRTT